MSKIIETTKDSSPVSYHPRPPVSYNPESESPTYLPVFSAYFILDDKMVEAERSKYTFLILLGDLGGFNGAIMIFPAFFMSFYAERMYKKAIAAELPTRRPQAKNRGQPSFKLPDSVLNGQQGLS